MVWLACTTAGIQIVIVLFAFTVFSFLPNWCAPPSNFWQLIPHTVGWISTNKPSITSCFLPAFTIVYSPTWNTQSSKFWQQILLPVLFALVDYWLRRVWIILKVPLTPRSQPGYKINCTRRGSVGGTRDWINSMSIHPCSDCPICDSAWSNYTICWLSVTTQLLTWLIFQVYIIYPPGGVFDLYGCSAGR